MRKILVIEDNYEVRENLCEILELSNYAVTSAPNGIIGVQMAVDQQPDLIICDVMMPELDGFGVLKILNRNPKTNDIPFIFLTAKAEKTDYRKGMSLGADDYITKPFDDTDILDAIEMRLAKSDRLKKSFDHSDDGLQRFFSEAKAYEEFEKLSNNREIRKYKAKDLIYEEGQTARWLFFVVSGQVKCYQINEFGKELITFIYGSGDFFGYFPLLQATNYLDNVKALEDCEIRLIPKDDFSLLLFNNRDFGAQFIKMLANRAESTEQQLIQLAYSSVRKRVANSLTNLADKSAKAKECKLTISMSRDDMAAMTGTAKETLIRTLSDFKSEGLIQIDGSEIVILDIEELRNIPQ